MEPPQFGAPRGGLTYVDRPAAYGLLTQAGALALVHVSLPGRAPFFDLPGGGVDAGEDEAQALVRVAGAACAAAFRAIGFRLGPNSALPGLSDRRQCGVSLFGGHATFTPRN